MGTLKRAFANNIKTDGTPLSLNSASVVTHSPETDLTPVRQDVLTLSLKQAVQENSTKFNLANSAITKFEADADLNLGGSTTTSRHTDEYIWAASLANVDTAITINSTNYATYIAEVPRVYSSALAQSGEANYNNASDTISGSFGTLGENIFTSPGSNTTWTYSNDRFTDDYRSELIMKLNYNMSLTAVSGKWRNGSGSSMAWHLHGISADGYTQTDPAGYPNISQASGNSGGMSNDSTYSSAGTWNVTTKFPYLGIFVRHSSANSYMYDTLSISGVAEIPTPTVSATGTALGTTNVPSSAVTDVSGVMLLKDESGTTTLGTDVKVYFTANNSAWTEATSYADAGTFSTGIKMIKLGKTTCTSGSDVRWKVVWANQSAGSNEARIHGLGINY